MQPPRAILGILCALLIVPCLPGSADASNRSRLAWEAGDALRTQVMRETGAETVNGFVGFCRPLRKPKRCVAKEKVWLSGDPPCVAYATITPSVWWFSPARTTCPVAWLPPAPFSTREAACVARGLAVCMSPPVLPLRISVEAARGAEAATPPTGR